MNRLMTNPITGGKTLLRTLLATAAVTAVTFSVTPDASAERIVGLTTQNSLTIFDSDTPTIADDGGFVSGLDGTLLAIDYRPANMELYGLSSANKLYTIDLDTLDASLVGMFSPRLNGTSFAFDFNPAFADGEFARIISETDKNRVISGDTGQYLPPVNKTDVFYADGDPNQGVNPNIAGIAYNNNVAGADSTAQFGIDASLGVLTTVANNAGTLNTIGSLFDTDQPITNELGFDISGATEIAYASIQIGPNSGSTRSTSLPVMRRSRASSPRATSFATSPSCPSPSPPPPSSPASAASSSSAAAATPDRRLYPRSTPSTPPSGACIFTPACHIQRSRRRLRFSATPLRACFTTGAFVPGGAASRAGFTLPRP